MFSLRRILISSHSDAIQADMERVLYQLFKSDGTLLA